MACPWGGVAKITSHRLTVAPTTEAIIAQQSTIAGPQRTSLALPDVLTPLVAAPDLAGVALADTQPPGSDGQHEGSHTHDVNPTLAEFGNPGYTPDQRLAFLRREGVDPVGLGPGLARFNGTPVFPLNEAAAGAGAPGVE